MCATASGCVVHPSTFWWRRFLTWALDYFFSHFFTDLVLSNTSERPQIPPLPFQHCCILLDFFAIGLSQLYCKCFILSLLFCFTLDRYIFLPTLRDEDWLRDRFWKRKEGTDTSETVSPLESLIIKQNRELTPNHHLMRSQKNEEQIRPLLQKQQGNNKEKAVQQPTQLAQ